MRKAYFFTSLTILFLLTFLFESSMVSFPLFLIIGLTALNMNRSLYVFIMVLLGGFILDSLRGAPLGSTSFFIFATVIVLMLYEKYFGSRDIMVIIVVSLISIIIYSILFSYSLIQLSIAGFILLAISLTSVFLVKKRLGAL